MASVDPYMYPISMHQFLLSLEATRPPRAEITLNDFKAQERMRSKFDMFNRTLRALMRDAKERKNYDDPTLFQFKRMMEARRLFIMSRMCSHKIPSNQRTGPYGLIFTPRDQHEDALSVEQSLSQFDDLIPPNPQLPDDDLSEAAKIIHTQGNTELPDPDLPPAYPDHTQTED